MAEFIGTENQVRLQQRLRDRQSWIAETPGLTNGGRILHFVDPDAVGWNDVAALAEEDRLAGFPGVQAEPTIAAIHNHLGAHWKTPAWEAFLGRPEQVLPACHTVIDAVPLTSGWQVEALEHPTDAQIEAVQALNAATDVSPYPAYYMRGEAVPVLTLCIWDDQDSLAATASAAYRYHPRSRLAGTLFAGMVSVSPSHRRRGLGKLVNARMLVESQARFGWTSAKEQVAADNAASRAMIMACGLDNSAGLVSVAAINSDERFSR